MSEATILRVRECRCPETPHPDGDTVSFPPRLGLNAGLAVTAAIQLSDDDLDVEVLLGRALFVWGPDGWNLADEQGKPRPFNHKALETEFPWEDGGFLISQTANKLYAESALAPLRQRAREQSKNGRTATSRSRTRKTKRGTRPPSESSSPEPLASTVSTQ